MEFAEFHGNSMDYSEIRIKGLKIFAHHGVYPEENEEGQNFLIDVSLIQDTRDAGILDDLSLSTNYGEVCLYIDRWMKEHTFCLIESVCEWLAQDLLFRFPLVRAVELEIHKPEAPISLPFKSVSVYVKRGWHIAYLSVGSNMGDREGTIKNALKVLDQKPHTRVLKVSSLIVTRPYGGVEQEDFLNGAVEIETLLPPAKLLEMLHEIENQAGRERKIHWGPRTLDLDIVFYDKLIYEDENLVIPHVDMENREFVLKPMCELAPGLRHPVLGKTMSQLLEELSR